MRMWISVAMIASLSAAAQAGEETNLLRNQAMTWPQGAGAKPVHWRPWKTPAEGEYELTVVTDDHHSAPSAFRIRGSKPAGRACIGQTTAVVKPSPAYRVRVWVRTEGKPRIDGFVRALPPKSGEQLFLRSFRIPLSPARWTQFETVFNLPEELATRKEIRFFANFYGRSVGTVWYDDAELIPLSEKHVPPPPPDTTIRAMRDLCIDTELVSGGGVRCVIVAPSDGRYHDAVRRVQQAVKRRVGVELPLRSDDCEPGEVLKTTHVIAVGNMATNRFVRSLYYQYYTYLDLWYPGKGGRVVRSLHDPFGTKRNVLFVGGSDDAGVAAAAAALEKHLVQRGRSLTVGWVMDIVLGQDMKLPDLGEQLHTWKDSFRKTEQGKGYGYAPGTVFGWNALSLHAALYYMSGDERYLREFVRFALPKDAKTIEDLKRFPGEAFGWHGLKEREMASPLVHVYHYHAHLMPLLWELIEESPHLTDAERLAVTNALREGEERRLNSQGHTSVERHAHPPRPGSRHTTYEALAVYAASRYFAKHYPQFAWAPRNLDHVASFFSFWTQDTYYGVTSTGWYNTFNESVLDYFLLANDRAFAQSGFADRMLSSTWVLWEGKRNEGSNRCQAVSMLRKTAWYTGDGKYLYFADLPTYDMSVSRIGQSYEPSARLRGSAAPQWLLREPTVLRLSAHKHQAAGAAFPKDEAYQLLSYRTQLGEGGDFFTLDGYFGQVSTDYHVQALTTLRIDGKTVLSGRMWRGYGCQLMVRRGGLMPTRGIPYAAALKRTAALPGMTYVHSQVPQIGCATWDRHILHLAGDKAVVVDEVATTETAHFDVKATWQLLGRVTSRRGLPEGTFRNTEGATVSCATPVPLQIALVGSGGWATVTQLHSAEIRPGAPLTILNVMYPAGRPTDTLRKLGPRSAVVVGPDRAAAYVGLGDYVGEGLLVRARAAYVSSTRIAMVDATALEVAGKSLLAASGPTTLCWRVPEARLHVRSQRPVRLDLAGLGTVAVDAGTHTITAAVEWTPAMAEALAALAPEPLPMAATLSTAPDWTPLWRADIGEPVTDLELAGDYVWAAGAKGKLVRIKEGRVLGEHDLGSPVRDVQAMMAGDGNMLVAGCGDGTVRAFDADGKPLWSHRCAVLPAGKWFSYFVRKGKPEHEGVFALAPIKGQGPLLAAVSFDSVTLIDGRGRPVAHAPVLDNWRAPMGIIPNTAVAAFSQGILTGASQASLNATRLFAAKWDGKALAVQQAFHALAPGQARMDGKNTRFVNHVRVADLDGDGEPEVLYCITGSWNELRVYDATGKPLWQRAFGGARKNSPFMRSLDVADVDGDGRPEVLVAAEDGWVYLFGRDGARLWSKRLPWGASRAVGLDGRGLCVGSTSGALAMLSPKGKTLRRAQLPGEITTLRAGAGRVVAATTSGAVAAFAP